MKQGSNEPKESRVAKRARLENIQKARESGKKYILPMTAALFVMIAAIFLYRYGFGEAKTVIKASSIIS